MNNNIYFKMATGDKPIYDERRHFFTTEGSDKRGNLFSKLLMDAQGKHDDPNQFKTTMLYSAMKAEDYEEKTSGMIATDLHNQIVDFLVNTAHYHRLLDKPTSAGTVNKLLEQEALKEVNNNLADIKVAGNALLDQIAAKNINVTTQFSDTTSVNDVITAAKANTNVSGAVDTASQNIRDAYYLAVNVSGGLALFGLNTTQQAEIQANVLKALQKLHYDVVLPQYYNALQNKLTNKNVAVNAGAPANEVTDAKTVAGNLLNPKAVSDIIVKTTRAVTEKSIVGQFTTLASNNVADQFHQNVYLRWGDLTKNAQDFYDQFVELRKINATTNQWEVVPKSQYNKTISNKNEYRINLKRTGGSTNFELALPKISDKIFDKIYYKDYNGNVQFVSPVPSEDALRTLYNEVLTADAPVVQAGGGGKVQAGGYIAVDINGVIVNLVQNWPDAKKVLSTQNGLFSINIDKWYRRQLFGIAQARISEDKPEDLEEPDTIIGIHRDVWERDSNGKFYKIVDGEKLEYGVDDEKSVELLRSAHNCYSTQVKLDGDDCKNYIYNCLLNDDEDGLKQCVDKLKGADFQKELANEINNMHPIIAYRTLQRFGFRVKSEFDAVAGRDLKKVISTNEWLKNFCKNELKDPAAQKELCDKNNKIINYLEHVVQFVNSNPSILNEDYRGPTSESVGQIKQTDFAKANKIPQRQEPYGAAKTGYEMGLFGQKFQQYSKFGPVSPFSFGLSTPFGLSVTPSIPMGFQAGGRAQRGGNYGNATSFLLRRYDGQVKNFAVGGRLIRKILDSQISELASKNKSIKQEDIKNINKRIDNLVKQEENLIRLVAYIEAYNKLLDATKDYSSKSISESDLQRYVQKQGSLSSKYVDQEAYLLKVVNKLSELVSGDSVEYQRLPQL